MSEIVIRHAESTDAQALGQLYAQVPVYSDTLQLPYPPAALWEGRLANSSPHRFALVACIDGKLVGNLTLMVEEPWRRRHVATFGIGVDVSFQGRGVGSKLLAAALELCDKWLQVKRVELTVYADNDAAIALYKKFGFMLEGRSPCYAMRDGELVDTLHMGRLHGV
ncbi:MULTISPECIES: GNAT family N-acetyltransferase [unclassified Rahnella]|uniref:GNAT family N-acetyltransferase n=1 Tax=unclassified Rahnella TaxID=2635087 RepID=UPI00070124FE|nr:GCN5 family acetyltransferase [Serratia sp. Leaf51]MBB6116725.1 putative acetyltransferase [Rahnella inusitata]THD43854.1 GNAT family N-acetyltransferase [Enterobacteriaceae bacterium ML5]